jgi:formylglycine-generating enzyme required for sulfatase activity
LNFRISAFQLFSFSAFAAVLSAFCFFAFTACSPSTQSDSQPSSPLAPRPSALTPLFTNSLGMVFVSVPGTKVQFCIWETRVQDFEALVNATGYDATRDVYSLGYVGFIKDGHSWKDPGFEQGPTHPVAGVSWDDAKAFCAWLTEKERKEGTIQTNQNYRLPTDAEWSIAIGLAKEDGITPVERCRMPRSSVCAYPWGPKWPPPKNFGNYPKDLRVDPYPFTAPVGAFRCNAASLFDLSGNVWEWCEDLYAENSSSRVYRGGSFSEALSAMEDSFLSWARAFGKPTERYVNRGFRVVLTPAL